MITSRHALRARTTIALALIAALVLAACGTRLDRDQILAAGPAAAGAGAGGTTNGDATYEPGDVTAGEPGVPGTKTGPGTGETPSGAVPVPGAAGAQGTSRLGGQPSGPGGGGKGKASGAPIVIGSIGTYSGPVGVALAPGAKALQVWAAAVNANGGINGRPVQVIVYDDGGDGAKARSQVKDLIETRRGVAIVASMSGLTLSSWVSYVEEKKVPVIGGDCSLDMWNEKPMLFPQCLSIDAQAYGAVAVGPKVVGKGKKWGMLACVEGPVCSYLEDKWFAKGYAKQAGVDPVYRARISIAQPDFTSECIQARNAGVELFSVVADPMTVARVAASCRRQGFHPRFLQGSGTVNESTAAQPGLSDVIVMMPVFPFAGLSTPAAKEFRAAYAKYGGGAAPGGTAALGWVAAKVFEHAARAAGDDVSTAGILKGLYTVKGNRFGGITSSLTYVPGKPAADTGCWFVMVAAGGRWTAPQGDRMDCR